jgi:hypothetical protein
MPNVTTNYVFFSSSKAETRAQRHAESNGGFQPAGPAQYTVGLTPQPYPWPQAPFGIPPSLPVGAPSPTYKFAFVNVSGGEPGGLTGFDPGNPPLFTVGSNPVNILVVYVPVGGVGGQGDSGASIDAFDETTGELVNDSFVTVSPDSVPQLPGDSLTSDGNIYGWVDTQNSAETITANPSTIEPTNAGFDRWMDLLNGPLTQGDLVFPALQGKNSYALAFYVQLAATPPPPPNACQEFLTSLNFLIREKRVPVTEVQGDKEHLLACLKARQITEAEYTATLTALNSIGESGPTLPPHEPVKPKL